MTSSPPFQPKSPPSVPFTLTAPTFTPYTPGSYSTTVIPRRPAASPPPPPSQSVGQRTPSGPQHPPSNTPSTETKTQPLSSDAAAKSPPSSYRLSTSILPFAGTQFRSQSAPSPPGAPAAPSSPPSGGAPSQSQLHNTFAPQQQQQQQQEQQQQQPQRQQQQQQEQQSHQVPTLNPSKPYQAALQAQYSSKFEPPQFHFQPPSTFSTTLGAQTPLKPQSVPLAAPTGSTRIQLALDYGTTFTGVAYLSVPASRKESELEALLDKIQVIQKWPPNQEMKKVPSQVSYSLTPKGCKQWGYDIDDNSLVLKRTKIQLEEVRERVEELRTLGELINRLRMLNLTRDEVRKNGVPKHLGKEPEDIVKDYLDKIADMTAKEISEHIGKKVLENIVIDLTVTHPAIWSDRALNSTYRAVRAAFNADRFPQLKNISFVPEPVACAHYTLREAWQTDEVQFNRNDCFIVVDAGGGTVDLASYKVLSIDHVKKQIKLEQVGEALGDTCGATCVDKSFEVWAEEKLGSEDWERLMSEGVQDSATGGHSIVRPNLRRLQDKFTPIKHQFDGKDNKFAWPIQLPRNANLGATDDASRAQSGALRVTAEDLRAMFDESVERTLYLVEQAVELIEIVEKLEVKKIFLSGGFAQSPYLFHKVKEFGISHQIDVQRGDDCWIAVAKGAIIKSLGVYTDKPEFVKPCPRHYGIKVRRPFASYEQHQRRDVDVDAQGNEWATDQIRWFIQKGDGMFPNKPIVVTHECNFSAKLSEFPAYQSKRTSLGTSTPVPVFREIVFVASSRDEAPTRLDATDKVHEEQISLKCDLTKVPKSNIEEIGDKKTGKSLKFHVKVEIRVLQKVVVRITSGGNTLMTQEIDL